MGIVLVFLIRLVSPLLILRWPLWGTLVCVLADGLDVVLIAALGHAPFNGDFYGNYYEHFDKFFDTLYLSILLFVTLKWKDVLARRTSIILYCWRLVGVVLIYLGLGHKWLLLFPNLFENFVVFCLIAQKVRKDWQVKNLKSLFLILFVCAVPKMIQEYYFHYLDVTPWPWIQKTFFK